jgi:hypothetical protein
VFRGLNRLLAAALVAGALLVAPSAALACGGGPSAENVYKECLPTGGGGTPTSGTPTGGGPSAISGRAALALKHAGKDRRVLASLINGYGLHRPVAESSSSDADTSPSALASALDLVGPTALLIALAAMALVLLGGSGMRIWRGRHRV